MEGKIVKILLLKEQKNPPDRRVAFLPEQCLRIQQLYPQLRFFFQPSDSRCIPDNAYLEFGINPLENPEEADILFGIKEVPAEFLVEGKTYFFFSHTIKKQAHNRGLLRALLSKKIEMIDYECLLDPNGNRTVAFGRFAGIVGAYNAFRMYFQKTGTGILPPASSCSNQQDLILLTKEWLPVVGGLKIAITGTGRVGSGAIEVLDQLGIPRISPEAYLEYAGIKPVYTVLSSRHYMKRKAGLPWDEDRFRTYPEEYESCFSRYTASTDILISCHFWNPGAPVLFKLKDIASPEFRISIVSDVTCDIGGSIPTTLRASSIASPFYDADRKTGRELPAFSSADNITVCAVDNLPCELPYDASIAFGEMLGNFVIPEIAGSSRTSVEAATICRDGRLLTAFQYLRDFAGEDHG
jgi:saccharopine dehydrogenase (NAD+, L-lysine-forming)